MPARPGLPTRSRTPGRLGLPARSGPPARSGLLVRLWLSEAALRIEQRASTNRTIPDSKPPRSPPTLAVKHRADEYRLDPIVPEKRRPRPAHRPGVYAEKRSGP